jgi:hypothetical protein
VRRAFLCGLGIVAFAQGLSAQTRADLTAELWSRERVEDALAAIGVQKTAGLLSEAAYQRRRDMLLARLEGTFRPTMLAVENPPDLIQNGGFEAINRNTRDDRSRWHWWQGWRWEGEYEAHWEDRVWHVRSGRYSARVTSTGTPGRIGVFTPLLPAIEGVGVYRFSVWAKGSGDNELLVSFDAGASGSVRVRVGPAWERVEVIGHLSPDARRFRVYLNITGAGTIWLDDATLALDPRP